MALTSSLVALFVVCCCLNQATAAPASRERRALWQLNTVIECYTGRSALEQMNGYGCWCGLGGSGKPVDATDRCCQGHDYCYQVLQDESCGVYFSSYSYTKHDCTNGGGSVVCTDERGSCARQLCECDRQLALCLNEHRDSYHEAFANFEKRFCDVSLEYPAATFDVALTNSTITVVQGQTRDAYQVDTVPVVDAAVQQGQQLQQGQVAQTVQERVDAIFGVDGAQPVDNTHV